MFAYLFKLGLIYKLFEKYIDVLLEQFIKEAQKTV